MLDVNELQIKLCKALSEAYPNDASEPGLIISFLKAKNQFYVSICRYKQYDSKSITKQAHGNTLEEALLTITKEWINIKEATEKEKLIKFIRGL